MVTRKSRHKRTSQDYPLIFQLLNLRNYYLRIVSCAISLLMLGHLQLTHAAEIEGTRVSISNDSLRISLDTESGDVIAWQVKERTSELQASNYRDFAAPAARLVVLGGTLKKVPVSDWVRTAGGWRINEHTGKSVELILAPAGANFTVRKSWTLSETTPWQAEFSIAVDLLGDSAEKDVLWLDVGPGIGEAPLKGLGAAQSIYSFTEMAFRSEDGVLRVRLGQEDLSTELNEGSDWVGLQSRYFAMILAPISDAETGLKWKGSTPIKPDFYLNNPGFETSLRVFLPLPEEGNDSTSLVFYGGGKSFAALRAAQPELTDLLFSGLWGWMRALTICLMYGLVTLYAVIGNWGVSIIVLAFFVRLLVHPLAKRALLTQKRFIALQEMIRPELMEIKKNYKGGEQSERILQLYEKNNTSPFAGLKPLLIVMLQIPIFIALYHLLGELFELRSEPFLWMKTLAEPDQLFSLGVELPFLGSYFNLLPALMALSSIASIKCSPAPSVDARSSFRQSLVLVLMTVGFFLLFYSFPSGMVLYWTVANLLHLAHTLYVQKRDAC
jgi:YidC/Oxa1 family membrane protein insertase